MTNTKSLRDQGLHKFTFTREYFRPGKKPPKDAVMYDTTDVMDSRKVGGRNGEEWLTDIIASRAEDAAERFLAERKGWNISESATLHRVAGF
jgi:hypothetical protein